MTATKSFLGTAPSIPLSLNHCFSLEKKTHYSLQITRRRRPHKLQLPYRTKFLINKQKLHVQSTTCVLHNCYNFPRPINPILHTQFSKCLTCTEFCHADNGRSSCALLHETFVTIRESTTVTIDKRGLP